MPGKGSRFRAKMDKYGRITVPSSEREFIGLKAGDWLEVEVMKADERG